MDFRKTGDKTHFRFVDSRCIGRTCWAPGYFQHRSPLSCGGSRNTGSPDTACCMTNAYRGCPEGPDGERTEACFRCSGADAECVYCGGVGVIRHRGLPEYDAKLAKQRKADGWKACH
jgi:hypothetical protein